QESQQKVVEVIHELKPDAVALELDEERFQMLQENEKLYTYEKQDTSMSEEKGTEDNTSERNDVQKDLTWDEVLYGGDSFAKLDSLGSILRDIGFFEQELATLLKTEQPGKEMLKAYEAAEEISADIYFIDQELNDINKSMTSKMPMEEALSFQEMIDEIIRAGKIAPQKVIAEEEENNSFEESTIESLANDEEEIDLQKILSIFKNKESLDEVLEIFQTRFPGLFNILLSDRNDYMVQRIAQIAAIHSKVAVILGYGHIHAIKDLLQKENKQWKIVVYDQVH
ncbi:MAG: TraB domain-containing protein, partial [Asgard group archaeon]|nr:TraB domain-containing protein [Asgard group archaeon]